MLFHGIRRILRTYGIEAEGRLEELLQTGYELCRIWYGGEEQGKAAPQVDGQ